MREFEYKSTALRDLKRIPQGNRDTIVSAVAALADVGRGDIRALNDQPGFRLRVGARRVIFDITADAVQIRTSCDVPSR